MDTPTIYCDFCSEPNPPWCFFAKPFTTTVSVMVIGSDGGWAACDECKALIDTQNTEALLFRSLAELPAQMRDEMLFYIKDLQTKFFANKYPNPAVRTKS